MSPWFGAPPVQSVPEKPTLDGKCETKHVRRMLPIRWKDADDVALASIGCILKGGGGNGTSREDTRTG